MEPVSPVVQDKPVHTIDEERAAEAVPLEQVAEAVKADSQVRPSEYLGEVLARTGGE